MPELPALSRRDALRLGAVVAAAASLAACTTATNTGPQQTTSAPAPGSSDDPDSALRLTLSAAEQQLTDLYAQVARALPAATAAKVSALGERHAAYQKAVSPGAAVSPPSPSPLKGKDPATLISRLRAAETAAAAQRAQQSVAAKDPELARLIVLAGAGAAAAAEALRGMSA